ncbi:MAG: carboxymuconolactone decarboxylase family protein [Pseudomonadota bacterium]|nr:carboxymuconolactone decarboxylase family protein [Pseudomonadota bacterium]
MTSPQPQPRVPMLSLDEARARGESVGLHESLRELSVFRVLLQHPSLAKNVGTLLMGLLFEGNTLDARLRELIIMRIGWVTGSDYEWTQHWRVALMFEISEAEILAVQQWRESDLLTAADKAVLQATDDVLELGAIATSTWQQVEGHLETHAERVELVMAIGNWRLFSQLLLSLQIPLEEGVESWPPGGEPAPAALDPEFLRR